MTKRPTDEKAQPGAAQAGDLPARLSADLDGTYRQVMEQYQDRLYAFALRFAGNAEDAEEIVQDAFVRAYRALAGYPAARIAALALRPWLYQITLNAGRNRLRKRRLNVVSLDGAGGDGWRRRGERRTWRRPTPSPSGRRRWPNATSWPASSPHTWPGCRRATGPP